MVKKNKFSVSQVKRELFELLYRHDFSFNNISQIIGSVYYDKTGVGKILEDKIEIHTSNKRLSDFFDYNTTCRRLFALIIKISADGKYRTSLHGGHRCEFVVKISPEDWFPQVETIIDKKIIS